MPFPFTFFLFSCECEDSYVFLYIENILLDSSSLFSLYYGWCCCYCGCSECTTVVVQDTPALHNKRMKDE